MIQDQTANSIADLAAVLREQEAMGASLAEQQGSEDADAQRRLLKEIESLSSLGPGGRRLLDEAIAALEGEHESMKTAEVDQDHAAMKKRKDTRHRLSALQTRRTKAIAVADIIDKAKAEAMAKARGEAASKQDSASGEVVKTKVKIDLPAIFKAQSSIIGALAAFREKKTVKQSIRRQRVELTKGNIEHQRD